MAYSSDSFCNPERKEDFLKTKEDTMKPQSILAYKRLFALFKQDEEEYEMDFCDFTYDMLRDVFDLRLSPKRSSKSTQLSLMKDYVGWCIGSRLKN